MAAARSKGYCYLCKKTFGKVAMKNHIFKEHCGGANDTQACRVLKVEGAQDKNYWLFIEVPLKATLRDVDAFLRKIWLECCGHMSAFMDSGYNDYNVNSRIDRFSEGDWLLYQYDFGDTTELIVTFMGRTQRPVQKEKVRLLARNLPRENLCSECGKPAEYVFMERLYEEDESPLLCEACAERLDMDFEMGLPVTNSPRMGVCAYEGTQDKWSVPEDAI